MDEELPIQNFPETGLQNPLRIYIPRANRQGSKIRKDGTQLCYQCRWCSYQSLNLGHTKNHMLKCRSRQNLDLDSNKRLFFEREVRNEKDQILNELQQMRPIPEETIRSQMVMEEDLQTKLLCIENRVTALEQGFSTSHQLNQKAKKITGHIIQEHGSLFLGCIEVELTKVIKKWLESGIDVEGLRFEIISKILDKFRQITFYDLVDNYKKNLEKFQTELQNKLQPKVHTKTWARIKLAYNFLKRYEEINLIHQSQLIEDLMKESLYLRTHVIRYHKKMVTEYSDLFPYKLLPKRLTKYEQFTPIIPPKISLDLIREEVFALVEQEQFQMATDLWMATSVGMRKSELLRIQFANAFGEMAYAVEMFQQKNKHTTIRMIPNSLKNMIKKFRIEYPMSTERFSHLRNFCLGKFHVFYGLRHLCFTTIMAGLFQNNALARVHKDHRTTSKFYIDKESEAIVNAMFNLPGFEQQVEEKNLILVFDMKGAITQKRLKVSDRMDLTPPELSVNENLDLKQMDGIIQVNDIQMKAFLTESALKTEEKSEIIFKRYALITEEKQIEVDSFESIQKTIQGLVSENDNISISEIICQEILQKGQIKNDNKILELFSQITDSSLKYVVFEQNEANPTTQRVICPEKNPDQQPIIIMKHLTKSGGVLYQTEQGQKLKTNMAVRQKLQRKAKELKSYYEVQNMPHLYNLAPFCDECSARSRYKLEQCKECVPRHGFALCDNCHNKKHISTLIDENLKDRSMIKIVSKNYVEGSEYYRSIPRKTQLNNIRKIIEQERGLTMITQAKYRSDVPDFACSLPIFSKKMTEQINFNRKNQLFLPLHLRQSSKQRGYGVFATQNIEANRLICTYVGVISTQNSADISHDSSFSLGWLQSKGMPLNILAEAKDHTNVGRFLNSSNQDGDESMNCSCKYGLLPCGQNFQVVIILFSVKQIERGDELLWYYGRKYWSDENKDRENFLNDRIQNLSQPNSSSSSKILKGNNLKKNINKSSRDQQISDSEQGYQSKRRFKTRHMFFSSKIILPSEPLLFQEQNIQPDPSNLISQQKRFSYFVKVNKGEILANHMEQKRWSIASLTKIIAAFVVGQDVPAKDWPHFKLVIPELFVRSEESRTNLKEGYGMTLQDLFHALLVSSGNDAAQALSQIFYNGCNVEGKIMSGPKKRGIFTHRMNKLAEPFKLVFYDESGYNPKNTGTAKQFGLILEKYYQDPKNNKLFEIMGVKNYSCQVSDEKNKKMSMTFSSTNTLVSDFIFGKTAHSKEQHYSFAGMIKTKKRKKEVFVVVLGAPSEAVRSSFLIEVKKMVEKQL